MAPQNTVLQVLPGPNNTVLQRLKDVHRYPKYVLTDVCFNFLHPVLNFLISTCQVILGWATRLKIIDPDSKQDVGDEVVGHVFVVIAIVLIYRLSDTIYM